jgi:hypothetical protein
MSHHEAPLVVVVAVGRTCTVWNTTSSQHADRGATVADEHEDIEEVEVVTTAVDDDGTIVVDDLKALVDEEGNVLATDETIAVETPDGTIVVDEVIAVADDDGDLVAIEEDVVVVEDDDA